MDINKEFEKLVEEFEKEWHDGHEPQGIDDQYVEEMEDEVELDELVAPGKKSATGYTLYHKDFSSAMQHAYDHAKKKGHVVDPKEIDDKVATGPKKPSKGKVNRYALKAGRKTVQIQVTNLDNKAYELNMYIEGLELIPEGFKDLPPHLQKSLKDFEKKQKKLKSQFPDLKTKTFVYNPETGKPDIEIKEKNMKLVDTVQQVLAGKPELEEHCGVCDEQGMEEDSNPEKPGKQGDKEEWLKARAKVLKKYGVKSCAAIKDEKTKKQCFQDLDDSHVADHEQGEDYKPKTKKASPPKASKSDASPDVGKISEGFWKVNIPDMPPIFMEAGSASEIKQDMRKKLKGDVFKELQVERVSKTEMVKKYREMAKGGGGDDEEASEEVVKEDGKAMHDKLIKASQKVADDYNKDHKKVKEVKATGTSAKSHAGHCESTDSKLYSSVKKMMKK